MTDTPEDWVLLEAAKRSDLVTDDLQLLRDYASRPGSFRALCDMIAKHEPPPVDRKLLCAREAGRESGYMKHDLAIGIGIRAIELWEEGFGK